MKLLIGITGSVAAIKINLLLLELQSKIPVEDIFYIIIHLKQCLETKLVATKNALHFIDGRHEKPHTPNFRSWEAGSLLILC